MSPIQFFQKEIEASPSIRSKVITLDRNDFLLKKGMVEPYIYFVESGALKIFYESELEDLIIRFGYQNSVITSLTSYFRGTPSEFSIQAIKKSKVIAFDKNDFKKFLIEQPKLYKMWVGLLEDLIVQQIEREIDILLQSPRERYQRVLKRSPQLFQEVPNKYIASYLRMSPETLSRLKKS